jgi:SAM-dependent methyltransferase
VYRAPAPAITSLSTRLDAETVCHVCSSCGHAQSPDLPDLKRFYDNEYKISLASDDHDQLYEFQNGQPVYRTAKQAELVLEFAKLPQGARVLDYGAAKAATLRSVMAQRPDLAPYVFDVSEDYRAHWSDWVPADAQATYRAPETWNGRLDLVTAHFVLEHVAAPAEVFADIARLLAPGGLAFVTVPDVLSNPGDLLVVDHVNHFTPPSVRRALAGAGMIAERIVQNAFRGAFVILARRGQSEDTTEDVAATVQALRDVAAFWRGVRDRILAAAARHGDRPAAIYGAGFYGALVAATLGDRQRLVGHLDRNLHVQAASSVKPVFDPLDAPSEIEVVYAGLNPTIARGVLKEWQAEARRDDVEVVYLDEFGGA